MKYAHSIKLTVFSYELEDSQRILDAFLRLFPFNLEEKKVALKKADASGFKEKTITIYETDLRKDSLINQFLENILSKLDKNQKEQILQEIEQRLDDNFNFILRFDKDLWSNDNKLILTNTGKCYNLRISIAAFPKKREAALKVMNELFSKHIE